MSYERPIGRLLAQRLEENPSRIQILAGPRQVGKTTVVRQVLNKRPFASYYSVAVDNPRSGFLSTVAPYNPPPSSGLDSEFEASNWLTNHWIEATNQAEQWTKNPAFNSSKLPFVFVVDEIQLVPQWSTLIKGLWDAMQNSDQKMHVLLLGSAPLLVQKGLSESLTGRYELLRASHWSFTEMNDAFDFTLDEYIYFGGYPGSAGLIRDEQRWRAYVVDALIQPSIEKDVLAMERVDKPALLRQLFELGCEYSGQIVALDKISKSISQGHVLTLARHLILLSQAGLLTGLYKFAKQGIRQRASPPKFQVLNNALMSASSSYTFDQAKSDRGHWGRLVESAVGAHLVNLSKPNASVHYWRDDDAEVDFVIDLRDRLLALEVKSGSKTSWHTGLNTFKERYPESKQAIIGSPEIPVGFFLQQDQLDPFLL
jgi:uncharacterized protein